MLELAEEALCIHDSVDVGWADDLELLACLRLTILRSEDHDIIRAEDDAYSIAYISVSRMRLRNDWGSKQHTHARRLTAHGRN